MKVTEVVDKIEQLEKMLVEYVNKNVLAEKEKDDEGEAYSAECISFSYTQDMISAYFECTECSKCTTLSYIKNPDGEKIEFRTKNVEKNDN